MERTSDPDGSLASPKKTSSFKPCQFFKVVILVMDKNPAPLDAPETQDMNGRDIHPKKTPVSLEFVHQTACQHGIYSHFCWGNLGEVLHNMVGLPHSKPQSKCKGRGSKTQLDTGWGIGILILAHYKIPK